MTTKYVGSSGPNWPLLAALRFLLALIVALFHTSIFINHDSTRFFVRLGPGAAVLIFLMLSGFSVTSSYSRERTGFFRRRWFRVAPNYWLGICLGLLPFAWGIRGETFFFPKYGVLLTQLVGLQPVVAQTPTRNGALWTMGIEECFYALSPLIISTRTRYVVLLAAISGYLALHYPNFVSGPGAWLIYLQMFWAFALGVLFFKHRTNKPLAVVILGFPALLAWIQYRPPERYDAGVVLLGALSLVYGHKLTIQPLLQRVLLYLGDLSFPLYVLHWPIAVFVAHVYPPLHAPLAVVLLITLPASILVLHCYDRPLRRLGRRSPVHAALVSPQTST